jgi:pyrophosphatase PpaX
VVTASDVERFKPDPEPVRRALEAAGEAEAGRSLFVGDSVHDLRAGRAAGTRTGAALWGPYGREELAPAAPDHWLEGLRELDAVLERGDK